MGVASQGGGGTLGHVRSQQVLRKPRQRANGQRLKPTKKGTPPPRQMHHLKQRCGMYHVDADAFNVNLYLVLPF
jgi:hypothetical protein